MASIRVDVTAEDVAEARAKQTDPIEVALARVLGVDAMVDRDVPDGYMATLGARAPGTTIVVNLPAAVTGYLERWWDGPGDGTTEPSPFAFDLELDTWLVALVARAASTDEQAQAVIVTEAAG